MVYCNPRTGLRRSRSPVQKRPRVANAARSQRRLTYAVRHPAALTASQIDPSTLAELPVEVQQEVLAGLGPTRLAPVTEVVAPQGPQDPVAAVVEAIVAPRGLDPETHAWHVAALAAEVAGEVGATGTAWQRANRALVAVVRRLVASNGVADGLLQTQLEGAARVALEHAVSVIQDDIGGAVELLRVAGGLVDECAAFARVGERLVEAVQVAFQAARGGRLLIR